MMITPAWAIETVKWVVPSAVTLFAGYLGAVYGSRQLRYQKRLEFVCRQLDEFYSPILACHEAIRAKSELRLRISQAADAAWREKCASRPQPFLDSKEAFKPFEKIREYDNHQLKEGLLPFYQKMLDVFTQKYWLAEPETRAYYKDLTEFVEIWNRWIAETLPPEVLDKLGHSEEKLHLFYKELEEHLSALRGVPTIK
jgi:hypothetical protein